MLKNLLIIKGYGKPHAGRWEEYEARHARDHGIDVFHPKDIPDFDGEAIPTRRAFREYMCDFLQRAGLEPDHTAVEAHSLGGRGWMDLLMERVEFRSAFTYLIATPKENRTGLPRIDDFFHGPDLQLREHERKNCLVIGSDNDRVIDELPSVLATHLSVESIVVPGAGHFMPRALHRKADILDLGEEWMTIREQLRLPF